ncbi:MAG: hypothetical protein M1813_003475 [Trichoglossum hirsutum]|nr:MAG: hypothetical protein M1813_003475 [Trichoglossum hirsutum]
MVLPNGSIFQQQQLLLLKSDNVNTYSHGEFNIQNPWSQEPNRIERQDYVIQGSELTVQSPPLMQEGSHYKHTAPQTKKILRCESTDPAVQDSVEAQTAWEQQSDYREMVKKINCPSDRATNPYWTGYLTHEPVQYPTPVPPTILTPSVLEEAAENRAELEEKAIIDGINVQLKRAAADREIAHSSQEELELEDSVRARYRKRMIAVIKRQEQLIACKYMASARKASEEERVEREEFFAQLVDPAFTLKETSDDDEWEDLEEVDDDDADILDLEALDLGDGDSEEEEKEEEEKEEEEEEEEKDMIEVDENEDGDKDKDEDESEDESMGKGESESEDEQHHV